MCSDSIRVDAHHHLWSPARGDYVWMDPEDPVLARRFTAMDLEPLLRHHGIGKTVLVQAAPSTAETEYLLGISDAADWIAGVTGWVDFDQPRQRQQLERFAAHPKFRGVRPMIQDIGDTGWMLGSELSWAFEAIIRHDLIFEALGFPRHIEPFLTLFQRYPEMRVIVDHGMKPNIRDHETGRIDPAWERGIRAIARDTSAWCKLSGLITEADVDWDVDLIRPYTDVIIDAFGTERVIWGSDWPVVTLRASYDVWFETTLMLLSNLDDDDQGRILGANAAACYRIAA